MFYYPSSSSNNNNNKSLPLDLEKTARLCWLDIFSTQTLSNIHAICLFCNQLSFEPVTSYLYSQPYDDKIYRQNITLCEKCSADFDDYQAGFLAREQYALDLYDYEYGIAEPRKPKLCVGDYYTNALQNITNACVLKLREKASIIVSSNT